MKTRRRSVGRRPSAARAASRRWPASTGRGAVRHDHRRVRLAVERPEARGVARGAGDDDVAPADERALERRDTSRRRAADDVRLDGVGVVGDEGLGRQQREPAAGGAELHLHDVRARQSAEETSEPAAPRLQRQQRLAQRRSCGARSPSALAARRWVRSSTPGLSGPSAGWRGCHGQTRVTLAPFAARPSATPRTRARPPCRTGSTGKGERIASSPARPPCVGRDPSGGGDSARGDQRRRAGELRRSDVGAWIGRAGQPGGPVEERAGGEHRRRARRAAHADAQSPAAGLVAQQLARDAGVAMRGDDARRPGDRHAGGDEPGVQRNVLLSREVLGNGPNRSRIARL